MLSQFQIHWHLFILATLCMALIPGIAMLYCISQSLQNGVKHGLSAALGVEVGTFIYVIASVILLSSLFHLNPLIFKVIQILGACYLIYLGIQALLHLKSINLKLQKQVKSNSYTKIFFKGLLINLANPKTILFLIAFLPQFIGHKTTHLFLPLISLGLLFNFAGVIVNVSAALIFNKQLVSQFVTKYHKATYLCNFIPGIVFLGLGVFTICEHII